MEDLLVEELGLAVLIALAFVNGANDVGKSVASLMTRPGQGKRSYYWPLLWGGVSTGLGSVLAVIISGRLFSVFTPQSLLGTAPSPSFALAALVGATVMILIGTLFHFSVSTTHAILGAIILQGAYLFGTSSLQWDFLAWRILLPLALGPFAALVAVLILDYLTRTRKASQSGSSSSRGIRIAHWGSSGAAAFARGVNDAPKMVVLGAFFFSVHGLGGVWLPYLIVACAVVAGSLVWGDRVAWTVLGHSSTLSHHQRVKSNAATAALISAGAYFGDPFSSTDVSSGATAGIGRERRIFKSALRKMTVAWLVTLPAAGLLAIATFYLGTILGLIP